MPLKVPEIKALCFDVDGTLSNTDDLYAQKVSKFFPRLLFKDPAHAARRFVMWIESPGNALLGLADSLHLDDEMVAFINWLSRHRRLSSRKFLLVPGVDEMLKQLHGRYPMAIVSARDEMGTMRFLEKFDLVRYFDAIVTGLSAKYTKPYPDPVLLAAQKMNVPPENCLMIGDTTVDIRAGKSAGAQTLGVLCGFGEEAELRRFGADEIVEDTTKLLEILTADGRS
ncbi:MAG: HAD family hydrolase [Anaerolineales bacterium]|nr:MAG: HAD family hydrolase [Chloroflexota bacterium]MCE7858967.1 HAD family hydrolase [Chloroflexi bacterium CFX2]MCK6584485.1 HAD family hydrolase [Anaerolineales bacterium]GJQ36001.1 MAG: phosphoglycolate phosphatase [Anaerolineaceae bacterium]